MTSLDKSESKREVRCLGRTMPLSRYQRLLLLNVEAATRYPKTIGREPARSDLLLCWRILAADCGGTLESAWYCRNKLCAICGVIASAKVAEAFRIGCAQAEMELGELSRDAVQLVGKRMQVHRTVLTVPSTRDRICAGEYLQFLDRFAPSIHRSFRTFYREQLVKLSPQREQRCCSLIHLLTAIHVNANRAKGTVATPHMHILFAAPELFPAKRALEAMRHEFDLAREAFGCPGSKQQTHSFPFSADGEPSTTDYFGSVGYFGRYLCRGVDNIARILNGCDESLPSAIDTVLDERALLQDAGVTKPIRRLRSGIPTEQLPRMFNPFSLGKRELFVGYPRGFSQVSPSCFEKEPVVAAGAAARSFRILVASLRKVIDAHYLP